MIDGRRVLGLVVARGGSKGVPGKNLAPVGGRPLIEWTVRAGKASKVIDRLIVSTDSREILTAAVQAGCEAPFVRPAELAGDEATAMAVIRHAMAWVEADEGRGYDYLALLQATSPFRTADDIDSCVGLCHAQGAPTALSVTAVDKSPYWCLAMDAEGRIEPLLSSPATRRQDAPAAFAPNGAVYVGRWAVLGACDSFIGPEARGYLMPQERSLDIDTPHDLRVAQLLAG